MIGRLGFRLVLALVLFLPALATPVFAQDATPSAGSMMGTPAADEGTMDNPMPGATIEPSAASTAAAPANTAGLTVVASGLAGPRGVAWDGSGALYVGLAGTGGTTPGTGTAMGAMGSSNRGGPSASIVKVVAGCGIPVARGLPSYISGAGSARGVAAIAFLGDDLYALLQGAGPEKGNPDWSNGVVRINADGSATPIFNLVEWMAANPVAHVPGDFDVNGDPFGLITVGRELYLAEANSSQIIQITEQGQATRAADLSDNHPVVTGLTSDSAGNLYVGYLTEAPYQDGASRVDRVSPDGTVTTVWTGLTAVTGLAFGPDNTLYATEMTHGMQAGSGRLVKQTGPDSLAEVVTGLDYPVHLAAGPDGALYVSLPALGSITGGAVLRVDPAATIPMQYAPEALTAVACSGAALPGDAASPAATPAMTDATPTETASMAPAASTPDASSSSAGEAQTVTIKDFAFTPQTLTIPAGTTVTWTNEDSSPHTSTATGGAWDSGNLNQGQSFSFTFTTAGTYDYVCSYHAGMTGTIIVT